MTPKHKAAGETVCVCNNSECPVVLYLKISDPALACPCCSIPGVIAVDEQTRDLGKPNIRPYV